MRLPLLLLSAALLLAAAPIVAPDASAAACDPSDLHVCVLKYCVFSYRNEPGCLVPNPCDPRFCDIWWPDPSILDPILP